MRLQLSLAAEGLPKASMVGGPPDPFAVVTLVGESGTKPTILGQTEVLTDSYNPDWTKVFYIDDFELGKPTKVIFSIFSSKETKTPLGSSLWEIGEILGAPGGRLAKKLKDGGVLIAHVEEATNAGTLRFHLRGLELTNTEGGGMMNKSDPFFELQRLHVHSRVWDTVFRSQSISNDLNPVWGESFVEVHALCGGQLQQKFRLVVYDWDRGGKHDVMGKVVLTVADLLNSVNETALKPVKEIVPEPALVLTSRGGKSVGKILVAAAEISGAVETETVPDEPVEPPPELDIVIAPEEEEITVAPAADEEPAAAAAAAVGGAVTTELLAEDIEVVRPSFVSYIKGGCQLRGAVAIDATSSNGDPRKETSLHHFKKDGKNAYEEVMFSLCSVLSNYDSDQKYPVYGFGAKRDGKLSHCFPIGSSAEVDGVDGILEAYRTAFRAGMVMSGPRDYSDVLAEATEDATQQLKKGQYYSILLIFTNGSPVEIEKTMDLLKKSEDAPLSIVIVGVGEDDEAFAGVRQIETEHRASGGRDNLCFVQYESLKSDSVKLTEAALDHIPEQMVTYFVSKGISPEPENTQDIAVEPYVEEDDIAAPIEINEQGQAVVTGSVEIPEHRKKFEKLMKDGVKEGRKLLKKNKRLVGRIKRRARRKMEKLIL